MNNNRLAKHKPGASFGQNQKEDYLAICWVLNLNAAVILPVFHDSFPKRPFVKNF